MAKKPTEATVKNKKKTPTLPDFTGAGIKGLMNKDSLAAATKLKVIYIDRNKIVRNPDNEYSIDGIEELAETIADIGLQQPIIVNPISTNGGGMYMLLAGERRLMAIDMLIGQGRGEDFSEQGIPAFVHDNHTIDLDLSPEEKELCVLTVTNKTQREKTLNDQIVEISYMRKIAEGMKAKGQKLGMSLRQYVSEQTGENERNVQRLDFIGRNLIEEFRDIIRQKEKKDFLGLTVAADIAGLTVDEQRELYRQYKDTDNLLQKDVERFREHIGKGKMIKKEHNLQGAEIAIEGPKASKDKVAREKHSEALQATAAATEETETLRGKTTVISTYSNPSQDAATAAEELFHKAREIRMEMQAPVNLPPPLQQQFIEAITQAYKALDRALSIINK